MRLLFPFWYDSESIVQLHLLCLAFRVLLLFFVRIRREASLDERRKHDGLAHSHCNQTGSIYKNNSRARMYTFYRFNNQKDCQRLLEKKKSTLPSLDRLVSRIRSSPGVESTYARIPPRQFLSAFGKSKLSSPEYGLK
jgi:hypothetical protein